MAAQLVKAVEPGLAPAKPAAQRIITAARRHFLALADAVAQHAQWPEMGRAGRALLEERFDWRVIQGKFRGLYEELLARPSTSLP